MEECKYQYSFVFIITGILRSGVALSGWPTERAKNCTHSQSDFTFSRMESFFLLFPENFWNYPEIIPSYPSKVKPIVLLFSFSFFFRFAIFTGDPQSIWNAERILYPRCYPCSLLASTKQNLQKGIRTIRTIRPIYLIKLWLVNICKFQEIFKSSKRFKI